MTSDEGSQVEENSSDDIRRIFNIQKKAFLKNPFPSIEQRKSALNTLLHLVKNNQYNFVETINQDFGCRSPQETLLAEVALTLEDIRHSVRHLAKWMKPRRRAMSIWFQPAGARVMRQPLGVVGIISPWNYPVMLAVTPLAAALAAGNRVILKVSENTPATSGLLARLIRDAFPEDHVAVVCGGPETARAVTHTPFDRLLYTGATARAAEILHAAADNLTPVTLELGGKNPAIIHPDFPMDTAAERLMAVKLFSGSQACVSLDYVMVQTGMEDQFIKAASASVARMYPTMVENPDYTSIINDKQYTRIMELLEDARGKGARIVEANPMGETFDTSKRKIPPIFVQNVTEEMTIAQTEIFSPLLMVIPYKDLDAAMEYVNSRPRPLALYYFDYDKARVNKVLQGVVSGTAAINDALWQFCVPDLPLGGVGHSGIGRYHGEWGFAEFSHEKGVFLQSRFSQLWTIRPPFGWITRLITRLMIR